MLERQVWMHRKKAYKSRIVKRHSSNKDTHLRTLIPIVCVYVDGEVQLTLLDDLDEMILTVTNQATGEQWSAKMP